MVSYANDAGSNPAPATHVRTRYSESYELRVTSEAKLWYIPSSSKGKTTGC